MSLFRTARRRPLLRIAARATLARIANRPDITEEQRDTLYRFVNDEDGALDSVLEIADDRMPAPGRIALGQGSLGASAHPFIDWLTNGGAAWLYTIAQIVAAMFGWNLPPLPPIPTPPPIPDGVP